MTGRKAVGVLALAVYGWTTGIRAQQEPNDLAKPTVPIVSVVGCASRTADGTWILTNATNGTESKVLFANEKELEEAKTGTLGTNSYVLIGTADFLTKEELLKHGQRAEFTRPEVANASGQLQYGRKLLVKGLLITTPNEKRVNLAAVHHVEDICER